MSDPLVQRQGQPILFLGMLVAGWFLVRVLTWQDPWPASLALQDTLGHLNVDLPSAADRPTGRTARIEHSGPRHQFAETPGAGGWETVPVAFQPPPAAVTGARQSDEIASQFDTHQKAVGHNLLFAAGMASLPMPRVVAELLEGNRRSISPPKQLATSGEASPWRVDGWVVLREGGDRLADGGVRPASYGASQLGAVLSFRLAPTASQGAAAYIRVSRALVDNGETEGAVGLRLQPVANLPVSVNTEARITERAGRPAEIRPAAFLAGGFDRLSLPAGVEARGYGQAGYVGGDFATFFADGWIVAEREVARFDLGRVTLGGGAWGGAQEGAARLDLGPSVTVDLRLGSAPARIEADYRWRVAGDAAPGNGGVLTLSTGF